MGYRSRMSQIALGAVPSDALPDLHFSCESDSRMDPVSIASSAIGAVATTAATSGAQKTQETWGWKGIATNIAIVVAILAMYQAYKTGSWRGITG